MKFILIPRALADFLKLLTKALGTGMIKIKLIMQADKFTGGACLELSFTVHQCLCSQKITG